RSLQRVEQQHRPQRHLDVRSALAAADANPRRASAQVQRAAQLLMTRIDRAAACALCLAVLWTASPLVPAAQRGGGSSPTLRTSYVRMGGRGEGAGDAVLYEPASGTPKNGIALVFGHPSESNFNHPSGRELARRGYRILMVNVQDGRSNPDTYAPIYSAAIKYLRGLGGVRKVVI